MEAAACAKPATGYTYARREPERTALFQVLQQHLLTFEQEWTDKSDGRTLPSFVTRRYATLGPTRPATSPRALRARPSELHGFMGCGILGRGFAHLFCKTCREHYAVAFSCKARAVCPSCLGRRMNEGTPIADVGLVARLGGAAGSWPVRATWRGGQAEPNQGDFAGRGLERGGLKDQAR